MPPLTMRATSSRKGADVRLNRRRLLVRQHAVGPLVHCFDPEDGVDEGIAPGKVASPERPQVRFERSRDEVVERLHDPVGLVARQPEGGRDRRDDRGARDRGEQVVQELASVVLDHPRIVRLATIARKRAGSGAPAAQAVPAARVT
jgi:hypothetical protein